MTFARNCKAPQTTTTPTTTKIFKLKNPLSIYYFFQMKYAFIICEISIHVYMEPQLFQKPTKFGLVSDNDNG